MCGKMNISPIKILLVEDDPGDIILLREALSEVDTARFELTRAECLEEALGYVADRSFDVILLDLSLPDEQGLDTLLRLREKVMGVPVIVLTGLKDEQLSLKAVQSGAQDYLVKGQVDSNLLSRSISYAIERHRLQAELEQSRRQEQQEREFHSLEQLSQSAQTSVSAQMFGMAPLHKSAPEKFKELVQNYYNLLELALEQRTYKVENRVSESLRTFAEQLGFLKAGPRDVVEIHRTGLKKKTDESPTLQRAQAYLEEGRLMVLELMGYLVSYYRSFSMGSRGNNASAALRGNASKEKNS
jgi:DNA-binding response OmpR family regulator